MAKYLFEVAQTYNFSVQHSGYFHFAEFDCRFAPVSCSMWRPLLSQLVLILAADKGRSPSEKENKLLIQTLSMA